MIIEKMSEYYKLEYDDLEIGDVYIYDNIYLMKIVECKWDDDTVNCVDLSDGELSYTKCDAKVELVSNARVVIG